MCVCGSNGNSTAVLYDLERMQVKHLLVGHTGQIYFVILNRDLLITGAVGNI